MRVHEKQGTWWIDRHEGKRRLRKETPAATRTEAKKPPGEVKAKLLPRNLGLLDPMLKCSELVTRHPEARMSASAEQTCSRTETALRNLPTWCPVKRARKPTPEPSDRQMK